MVTKIWISLSCLALFFCVEIGHVSAQATSTPYITIPFNYVETWSSSRGYSFPKKSSDVSSRQTTILQYFLGAQGYVLTINGVFDTPTRAALSQFQNGDSSIILDSTVAVLNTFFGNLYCPQDIPVSATSIDFRLNNVNKTRILPYRYTPSYLVLGATSTIPSMGYICLEKETNDSFQLMYDAAQKDNVQLSVTSSYRSEDSQQYLLKVMIKQLGKVAYRIVAPPGKSEHNLGTAIDIGGYDSGHLTSVSSGKTFAWLQQHAGEYGFVNSYPVGQEEVTGFKGEPWHWRYVGIPVAQSIVGDKVTLGAFLDTFKGRFQTFYQSIQDHYYALLSTVTIGS